MADDASPPRLRRRLVFSASLTLLLLAALEGGLRIAGFSYVAGESLPLEGRRLELDDERMFESDPELLWRLRASETIDVGTQQYPRFTTNDRGLRGPAIPQSKTADELRVLCLGDSVMFGQGLRDGETVPELLAIDLERQLPEGFAHVRVINGGVSGYSIVQGERLHARLADLEPDVVVLWFGINDAKPSHGVPDSEVRLPTGSSGGLRKVIARLRTVQLAEWLARSESVTRTRVPSSEFGAIVRRFEALSRRPGGPAILFVRFPERMRTAIEQLDAAIKRARDENADEISGPAGLLLPYSPALPRLIQRVSVVERAGRRTVVFGDPRNATHTLAVSEVGERAERLRAWKQALDALLEQLPPDSVAYAAMFGDEDPHELFTDNCHLTTLGARHAASALAARVQELASQRR